MKESITNLQVSLILSGVSLIKLIFLKKIASVKSSLEEFFRNCSTEIQSVTQKSVTVGFLKNWNRRTESLSQQRYKFGIFFVNCTLNSTDPDCKSCKWSSPPKTLSFRMLNPLFKRVTPYYTFGHHSEDFVYIGMIDIFLGVVKVHSGWKQYSVPIRLNPLLKFFSFEPHKDLIHFLFSGI